MRLFSCGLLCALTLAVGCKEADQPSSATEAAQPVSFNTAGLPVVEIDVPNLHCESCSATACKLLSNMPGVEDVKADFDTKKTFIAVDESQFDGEAARSALEEQFGEATLVTHQPAQEVDVDVQVEEPAGESL